MEIDKAGAEALISQFKMERLLRQDQAGRRIALEGQISDQRAVLVLERAPFPVSESYLSKVSATLKDIQNLGANDVYHWYLASTTSTTLPDEAHHPDLKVNLFYPATDKHVNKYSKQNLHVVHETPQIYKELIRPYMERSRGEGRLRWMRNIIDGNAEVSDVIYRTPRKFGDNHEGFVLLPDLNWDRKTVETLHLLTLVERNDIWSLRDLKKKHLCWLRHMKSMITEAVIKTYLGIQEDQLKFYVHYQPTYYHFHIHVVHVALEAGATQATGKAVGYESIISQLETMAGGEEAGMHDISITYTVGEADDLWNEIFGSQISIEHGSNREHSGMYVS